MAKNGSPGHGRIGPVKGRTQVQNPANGNWVKRDTKTGKFMDQKQDGRPFKGVTKEK